jgi:anti-anti-sigma factor
MRRKSDGIRTRRYNEAWVVSLPTELGAEIEDELLPAIEPILLSDAQLLVLDFSSVKFANSAGIGTLVDLFRRARERNLRVAIAGASGQPEMILGRVGFFTFAHKYPSVQAALGRCS